MVSALLARSIIVTIGILHPAYRSYKSLIASDLRAVVDCLRYWIVFSIFIACETITDVLLCWFPFYYWIKIFIVLWMISPSGSTILYKRFVQPVLKEREQDIDQLLEQTKQKGYSTLLDLTNKGFRYASNMFLNTAVMGQAYLGEHLKRSLSTSDIPETGRKPLANLPATVYEEDEDVESEFRKRSKADANKTATKTTNGTDRRTRTQRQEKPLDSTDIPSDETTNTNKTTTTTKTRTGTRGNATVYNSNESAHLGTISKRKAMKTNEPMKKPSSKTINRSTENLTTDNNDDQENLQTDS